MRQLATLLALLSVVGCSSSAPHYNHTPDVRSIASLRTLLREGSATITEDIYISGCVVLNDKYDELTHTIVVVDESGGIEIAIDCEDIDAIIPLHSRVTVHCSGLQLGRNGHKMLLGAIPTAEFVVDRIAQEQIFNYISCAEICDDATPIIPTDIQSFATLPMLSYVTLADVRFVEASQGAAWCQRSEQDGDFVTTLRHITDGDSMLGVIVDGTAQYASDNLPEGRLRCYGVVDYYDDCAVLRICNRKVICEEY